jgi:hypothetical protein
MLRLFYFVKLFLNKIFKFFIKYFIYFLLVYFFFIFLYLFLYLINLNNKYVECNLKHKNQIFFIRKLHKHLYREIEYKYFINKYKIKK